MRESTEITDVVDAFDDYDDFDLHLGLGFSQTWKSADITRETHSTAGGLSNGGYTASNLNVGSYSETTSRLHTRADIGVYKDIAVVFRLPIILSHDRELKANDGSDDFQELALQGAPGEGQLFSLPFTSPTRSGIEYLAVGLDFGILNQWRDPTKPNWVFGFEGRFNVSEPMHACTEDPQNGQLKCAYPSDTDRDGVGGEEVADRVPDDGVLVNDVPLDGSNFSGGREEGVSRGTTGLEIHTYLSKRVKYIEPYGGFSVLFEFQNDSSDYGQTDLQGALVNHPPFEGSMILGLAVVPWEIYDQYQRLTLDFRLTGSYRTEGRDYSPLFDALGSSDADSLRHPNFARYEANPDFRDATDPDPRINTPSVIDPGSQRVYTTGLTDVQQHGIYKVSTELVWQAGKYVKFGLGGAFTLAQGHMLTFDQPCNPDFTGSVGEAGPCHNVSTTEFSATGIPNPNYRPVINAPGRRFRVGDATSFDGWINATVMF